MGLEKVFNKQLSGRDGINNTATDSYGVQLPGSSKKKRSVQNGDESIQHWILRFKLP